MNVHLTNHRSGVKKAWICIGLAILVLAVVLVGHHFYDKCSRALTPAEVEDVLSGKPQTLDHLAALLNVRHGYGRPLEFAADTNYPKSHWMCLRLHDQVNWYSSNTTASMVVNVHRIAAYPCATYIFGSGTMYYYEILIGDDESVLGWVKW